ncbi:MAG: 4-alpha-glucanotransferase [Bradyrhizobiaceae bacterium]|nr:MAG: 4-alpha-glucanotransferase [Bradyrhizobiaceae bacterium]
MDLFERAAKSGISPVFIDGNGQRRDADPQALLSVLDALDHPVQDGALESLNAAFKSDDMPHRAYDGDFGRRWLLAVQLYGIRSQRNWGIGDFTDLQSLLAWASGAGAAGIGLNPLHALFDDHADDCSPYSPNSRLFLNSIYIDIEQVPELPPGFRAKHGADIERLRQADLVDYDGVADLKTKALREAFKNFKSKTTLKRKTDFEAFRASGGALLSRFACFEFLRRKYPGPWWEWPAPWTRPDDTALASLRRGPDNLQIEYFEFVQWCADRQLAACASLAEQLGMPVGLYLDIAVGVKADGFDAWNEQIAIARQLSVGAPPDQLNTAGQDWGLAGFNAAGLEHRAFAPFRDMLRASMRYAGAIRLDHVLGLNRLYVVPHGYAPHQGVYIQMPFEEMLEVAAQESVAHRCIVIGEDLGTVPDGFRERLADRAIWSYRVMIFERDGRGDFIGPDRYPKNALVTFSTHDLPTFAGWRSAHDIDVKLMLGMDPGETSEQRREALARLRMAVGDDRDFTFGAVLSTLSNTPSRLLGVSIEDLLGVADQANVPGTIDEHPNWRRRLPVAIELWGERIDPGHLRDILKERIV